MSRFFTSRYRHLTPYQPGEQPCFNSFLKLNTNESPFPPTPQVQEAAREAAGKLHLYSDPECTALRQALARTYQLSPRQLLCGNGSDELLYLAFLAFCGEACPAVFPDITYGFYSVFAEMTRVPFRTVPLLPDFSIDLFHEDLDQGTIFLANPNAPTGLWIPPEQLRAFLERHSRQLVVVDEAYVDFAGESALGLLEQHANLLVIQTFSKSRSLAGGRLGFCAAHPDIIADLNTLRNSLNPYNVNRMTMAAGIASLSDPVSFSRNCQRICQIREACRHALEKLGFTVTASKANFLFASHPAVSGKKLYQQLKAQGILVRHFDQPRISSYIRITIGTQPQMDRLLDALETILLTRKESL